MQIAALWAIEFEPAPMMFNCQTDDDAKDFAKERIRPSLESCPSIAGRLPQNPSHNSTCSISLPEMFLLIQGANLSNLQSKSIRWQFNDEVFLWEQGLLDHARKRTTQFWNRRIFNASTAGNEGEDLDRAFQSGDCRVWHLLCPSCAKHFEPTFETLDFKAAREGEQWNFAKARECAAMVCPHCESSIANTEANHKSMNAGGKYIATNPRAVPGCASFRFNALCLSPSVLSWGDLAVEFIQAKELLDNGYDGAMREFKTKRLALSWNPTSQFYQRTTAENSDYQFEGVEKSPGKFWEKEVRRFMTIDRQKDHRWAIVRAFTGTGESRLVWEGRLNDDNEVRAKQLDLGIEDDRTILDCGFEEQQVFELCCQYGWRAMRGDDARGFTHFEEGERILRPYSAPMNCEPYIGRRDQPRKYQHAVMCRWSNPTIKDFLNRLKQGKGLYWGIPRDVSANYLAQIDGEQKREVVNKRTGRKERRWVEVGRAGNHLWDCECMALVCAIIDGLLAGEPEAQALEKEA